MLDCLWARYFIVGATRSLVNGPPGITGAINTVFCGYFLHWSNNSFEAPGRKISNQRVLIADLATTRCELGKANCSVSQNGSLFLGLRHVALNVRDVRASVSFYSTVLGMKLEWMPDDENAYLTSGHDNLALHQLPAGSEPGPVQMVHHIGFVVKLPDDVDTCWSASPSHRCLAPDCSGEAGQATNPRTPVFTKSLIVPMVEC